MAGMETQARDPMGLHGVWDSPDFPQFIKWLQGYLADDVEIYADMKWGEPSVRRPFRLILEGFLQYVLDGIADNFSDYVESGDKEAARGPE